MTRLVWLLAIVATTYITAASCEDGSSTDQLTVEEYFDEWSSLLCNIGEEQRDFRTRESDQSSIESIYEYNGLFQDYVDRVENLSPPEPVATVHARFVEAQRKFIAVYGAQVDAAATVEAGGDATPHPDYDTLSKRASDDAVSTTADVRQLAQDLGIDKPLGCPGEFD